MSRPLDPLTPEERALADSLARLGPHGEPPASLDARILAAAHAAVSDAPVQNTHRRRWPLGLGVAASALLAVGIAWQLRPVDAPPGEPAAVVASDARPADTEPLAAIESPAPEEIAAADAAGNAEATAEPAPATMQTMPPPPRQVQAPRVATRTSAPAVVAAPPPPPAPPAPRAFAPSEVQSAPASEAYARTDVDDVPIPLMAPGASPASPAAAVADRGELGSVADSATTAKIAAQREQARAEHSRSLESVTVTGARAEARNRASQKSAELQEAVPSKPTAQSAGFASQSGPVRNTLKRTDLQLPVAEDGKLEPDDWLERIRLRRDLGDRASASESLLRFKQTHPFQKVPDDLQELLGP